MHKWCRTEMFGVLRLIQVKEEEGYPVTMLQLTGTDPAGSERDVVFEYELPFNFVLEAGLTRNFCAISLLQKGEYVGFFFENPEEKESFVANMQVVNT